MKFVNSKDVEEAFYAAFEQRDIELMNAVWEPSDEVCCVHPGTQRLIGIKPVLHSWEQIFSVKNNLHITISEPIYMPQEATAIHYVFENLSVENQYMGVVCATNIYRESEQGWRMILHHANALIAEDSAPKQFH